jgi:hypothetical protein
MSAMFPETDSLFANDEALKSIDRKQHNHAPSAHDLEHTIKALEKNNHTVIVVDTEAEALAAVVKLIPKGKSVNTAGSTTLREIGFTEALKANAEGWVNLKEAIVAETDAAKQADLRRQSAAPDFHVTSVQAIDHHGTIYVCCATGSRTGPLLFGPSNVIVVAGVNKIVKDKQHAHDRLEHYTLPLESARVRVAYAAYGAKGSSVSFKGTVRAANPFDPTKRITVVLVKKTLGF